MLFLPEITHQRVAHRRHCSRCAADRLDVLPHAGRFDGIAGQELTRDRGFDLVFGATWTGLEGAADRALAECGFAFEKSRCEHQCMELRRFRIKVWFDLARGPTGISVHARREGRRERQPHYVPRCARSSSSSPRAA